MTLEQTERLEQQLKAFCNFYLGKPTGGATDDPSATFLKD